MPDMEPAEEQVHEQEPDGAEVETEKEDGAGTEAKQCRICLDGDDDPDLGRLIRPCLCKGSMTVRQYRSSLGFALTDAAPRT